MKIKHYGLGLEVGVTTHAMERFIQRHMLMNPNLDVNLNPIEIMEKSFSFSRQITTPITEERNEHHVFGADYYRNRNFTFVVVNDNVVTVEIHGVKQSLNRIPLGETA